MMQRGARREAFYSLHFDISFVDYEGGVGRHEASFQDALPDCELEGLPSVLRMLGAQLAAWSPVSYFVSALLGTETTIEHSSRLFLQSGYRDERGSGGFERLRVRVSAEPSDLEMLMSHLQSEGLLQEVESQELQPWIYRDASSLSSLE